MLYDISRKITKNSFVYIGDPKIVIRDFKTVEEDGFRVSKIIMGLHTETHIDFPAHILKDGKTSSSYDISHFSGNALVVDIADLDFAIKISDGIDAIFIKTENFETYYLTPKLEKYRSITEKQARRIAKRKIKFVGIDWPTIEKTYDGDTFHKLFLGNDILIIENLDFTHVVAGLYKFYAFPMDIPNVEAALTRVVLEK